MCYVPNAAEPARRSGKQGMQPSAVCHPAVIGPVAPALASSAAANADHRSTRPKAAASEATARVIPDERNSQFSSLHLASLREWSVAPFRAPTPSKVDPYPGIEDGLPVQNIVSDGSQVNRASQETRHLRRFPHNRDYAPCSARSRWSLLGNRGRNVDIPVGFPVVGP